MADTTVAEINEKLKQIEEKIQEFFRRIRETLAWVPESFAGIIEIVENGLQAFNGKLKEFWDQINKFFENLGSASSLKDKADQWTTSVAEPIGEAAGTIALNHLRANIEWEGRAAEAYKSVIPSQGEKLSALKDLATTVQRSLNNFSNALIAFYAAIGIALGAFYVGMTGAVVACCSAVGAPAGVAAAIQTIGVVLGIVSAAGTAIFTFASILTTEQTSLTNAINDIGKEWPKSVFGDLSDGSVSDGDNSDWRTNQ